jgi:hypothetical protein
MVADYRTDSTVFLPGGLILDEARRIDEVELRPLTGREEEWLASNPSVPNAVAVSHLLTRCVVRLGGMPPASELIGKLLVGDRQFLILQLRRLTLGGRFDAVMRCPACPGQMDVSFETGNIPIDSRPQSASSYSLELPEEDRGLAREIRFRLPNGADQDAIVGIPIENAVEKLLTRCLLEDGGRPLSPAERQAVNDAMENLAPQVDLQLDLTCPECGNAFTSPFDTSGFFFDEMRRGARQLLREVHTLAFYYHWSESEILSLRRDRRRAYLGLLSDELRRD